MSEVLVSALLARLSELEQLAEPEGDGQGPDGSWHTKQCGYRQQEWQEACECTVPAEVLRLCRAHRDITEDYQIAVRHERRLTVEGKAGTADAGVAVRALRQVLKSLAWGLGVEETEGNE